MIKLAILTEKTLKFAPELVPLVLSGTKHSTWRIEDDKDLQPEDSLTLIRRPEMTPFARARVTRVLEKPIGEMKEEDRVGHEKFSSNEVMCKTYSEYYGQTVTPKTRIKIIFFELTERL
jgi:hypothetical protein